MFIYFLSFFFVCKMRCGILSVLIYEITKKLYQLKNEFKIK